MNNLEVVERLKALDLTDASVDDVREVVMCFAPKILRMRVSGDLFIERLREGIGYTKRCDVSYKLGANTDEWNRATVPGRSIFYGTLTHPNEDPTNRRYIAICESSKLYRQGPSAAGVEMYTLSRWLPMREIKVGFIANNSVFQNKNNRFLKEAKEFLSEQGGLFIDESMYFSEYVDYVTEEFSKPVAPNERYKYKISAVIADCMMYMSGLDGVIYPSVQVGGEAGMNIALKKECVDEVLWLNNVVELVYYQKHYEAYVHITRHSKPIEKDSHGMLNWKWE